MIKKYKYVYDKQSGHFIKKLNEDDSNVTTDTQQETKPTEQKPEENKETSSSFKSVESDEVIQKLNIQIQQNEKKFQDDLNTQNKLLDAAKANASKKAPQGIYDPVATDPDVLNIMKKITDMTKQHAIDKANFEYQKITQLQKLSQTNESYYKIPEKYKGLNESNIHTAKIYMGNLIAPDEDHILKGMADFKRAFKETNLLYGKDRQGYFVIAVDKDDFDTLSDTLEELIKVAGKSFYDIKKIDHNVFSPSNIDKLITRFIKSKEGRFDPIEVEYIDNNNEENYTSYSHNGQHSLCAKSYFDHRKWANFHQYVDLYQELVRIGYKDLEVLNKDWKIMKSFAVEDHFGYYVNEIEAQISKDR